MHLVSAQLMLVIVAPPRACLCLSGIISFRTLRCVEPKFVLLHAWAQLWQELLAPACELDFEASVLQESDMSSIDISPNAALFTDDEIQDNIAVTKDCFLIVSRRAGSRRAH